MELSKHPQHASAPPGPNAEGLSAEQMWRLMQLADPTLQGGSRRAGSGRDEAGETNACDYRWLLLLGATATRSRWSQPTPGGAAATAGVSASSACWLQRELESRQANLRKQQQPREYQVDPPYPEY